MFIFILTNIYFPKQFIHVHIQFTVMVGLYSHLKNLGSYPITQCAWSAFINNQTGCWESDPCVRFRRHIAANCVTLTLCVNQGDNEVPSELSRFPLSQKL